MNRPKFTQKLIAIFTLTLLLPYSFTFDIRSGMSKPWKTINSILNNNRKNNNTTTNTTIIDEIPQIKIPNITNIKSINGFLKSGINSINTIKGNSIPIPSPDVSNVSNVFNTSNMSDASKIPNPEPKIPFREEFLQTKIDHFSFDNNKTFNLRYLINDQHFNKTAYQNSNSNLNSNTSQIEISPQPIFFYCGNEGSITDFWNNSGFLTKQLAETFNALIIFGEHRFFGKSFPIGDKQDYDINKNKFLTVEQAMADHIELLRGIKERYNLTENRHPVIAFGGSYGGMLAAWNRMKFPNVYSGALASSAPILLFEDIDKISNSFFKIVTDTYRRYDERCPGSIRKGFASLEKLMLMNITDSKKFSEVSKIFNTCGDITSSKHIKQLQDVLEDGLVTLAQYNYPYPSSYVTPMPGYPVSAACENIAAYKSENGYSSLLMNYGNAGSLMSKSIGFTLNKFTGSMGGQNRLNTNFNTMDRNANGKKTDNLSSGLPDQDRINLNYLKQASKVFFNYTGQLECLDIGINSSNNTELNGWEYMACTEMVMPMQKDGITDMFTPAKWDVGQFSKECTARFNADVRPKWAYDFFGGRDFSRETRDYSNILFINGKMDPWNAGCPKVNSSMSKSVNIIECDSAHHLDLRYPNEKDPKSMVAAREVAVEFIKEWIK